MIRWLRFNAGLFSESYRHYRDDGDGRLRSVYYAWYYETKGREPWS